MIVASSIQANAEALLHPKMIVFDMGTLIDNFSKRLLT